MFYLISYDIKNTKRRTWISKLLLGYGERVQYSVFECEITHTELPGIMSKIKNIIDLTEDSIRIYYLTEELKQKIRIIGLGKITEYEEVYVI